MKLSDNDQPFTPTPDAAEKCPTCGGTGLTGIIADDGSGVKEPCPSCRYGFGPEIKSQAAQAEPALPRKAHVSQEAEECKVGAAPSEIPLKEWLAVQDAYKEAYETSRTPSKEWTYRGSLVSADFILCRFGKTVAVVPDAAVVRELVDSLNNNAKLRSALMPFAQAFDPKLAGWYFNMDRLRSAKAAVDSGGGK